MPSPEGNREDWHLISAHEQKSVGQQKSDNIFSNILIDTSPSHNFIERRAKNNHSWKRCMSVTKSRSLRRVYLFFTFFYFHFSFLSNSLCLFIYSLFIIFLLFIFLAASRLVDYFAFSCLFYVLYFYFSFSIFYSFSIFIIL